MKFIITGVLTSVALVWGLDLVSTAALAGVHPWWLARQQLLILSGYLSMALMSMAMLLATRPLWLEGLLGGMDRVYRTHKWVGILAVALGAMHWMVELSGGLLITLIGRAGRVPKVPTSGAWDLLRHPAAEVGEWAIYALLVMLVLTLWRRFPYRHWRILHQAMPVLYLVLVLHAVVLAPKTYWTQPAGALLIGFLGLGIYGALHALRGTIGRRRRVSGRIVSIERLSDNVLSVRCQLDKGWRGHLAGQFAFVRFERREGAHPFTIASSDEGDANVTFQIKALGDYTRTLPQSLHLGQRVEVEGPYGRFSLQRRNPKARQIWIAGGIGVTPFLAWLESLQPEPSAAPIADLHYCTRDQEGDPFVVRLQALCARLPSVTLHIHDDRQGRALQVTALPGAHQAEIWFCGPSGLARALREGLRAMGARAHVHQEAFEVR